MKKSIYFVALIIIAHIVWYMKDWHTPVAHTHIATLNVGTTADYPPFCYIEHDTIVGFEIDVIKEIAQRMDVKINLVDMPFLMLLPGLSQGKFDVIAGGITPNPQQNKVLFTQPYYQGDPLVIVALPTQKAHNLEDLHGKTVIVNDGYTADLYMSKQSGPILKRLPSIADAILALKSEKADAFVTAMSTIHAVMKHEHTPLQIHPIPHTQETYALVVSKENPALHQQIVHTLSKMIEDGSIEQLTQKWGLK
jgi:ABC-type amino acid transport substrate-binding protein